MQMNDLMPIVIITILLLLCLYALYKVNSNSVRIIEEDNPEYLEQLAIGRTNFLNEIVDHLRIVFALTEEEVSSPVVEVVGDQIHRITLTSQDQIFTLLIKWNKTITITCYRNKEVKGKQLILCRKKFSIRYNCVNWKKIDAFLYDVLEKFIKITNTDETFRDLLTAAIEVASSIDDNFARELLYTVAENYPWQGEKVKQRESVKAYTSLLAYILKFHREEFVEYMKETDDPAEQDSE